MNREELLAALQPHGDEVVLRTDMPELGHLGAWLTPVANRHGELVIQKTSVLPPPDEPSKECLVFSGRTRLLNTVVEECKAVFVLNDDGLDHFYLLFRLPPTWRMAQSFSDLPSYSGGAALFDRFHFVDPCFVLSARAPGITEDSFGLDNEIFEYGLNLFAAGLDGALPLQEYGLDHFPLGADLGGKPPRIFKALIDLAAEPPVIKMLCWWPTNDNAKIAGASVKRMGLGLQSNRNDDQTEAPFVTWLWDLQLQSDEEPFVVIASVPRDASEAPEYSAIFSSPKFLNGGASALTSLTDGNDPTDSLPFEDGPTLNIATLSFQPGSRVGGTFVLLDNETDRPYIWEAIDGFLTVENCRLSLGVTLAPEIDYQIAVGGVAEIEGYRFEVEVIPDQRVSGKLIDPHAVEPEAYVEELLGQPLDFPNLQIELHTVSYNKQLAADSIVYDVVVGGKIDLLGSGGLFLESIGVFNARTGGRSTHQRMTGTLTLADTPVHLVAEHQVGSGWVFEGSANPYQEIQLQTLADDLVHRGGMSMPPEMPEVRMTDFGLRCGSEHKQIRLWGRAQWRPSDRADAPWVSGEITTAVDISSATNPQTSQREVDVDLLWTHTSGNLTFEAAATHNHDGNSFLISWAGGTGQNRQTLGLHELCTTLHLDSLFPLPEGDGWSIFEFSHLLVNYNGNPRLTQLQSVSRLSDGELIFDADFSRDHRTISANWTGDGANASISIEDLLDEVGLPAEMDLMGSIGSDVFDFSKLSLQYLMTTPAAIGSSNGGSSSDSASGATQSSLQFIGLARDSFYKDAFVVLQRNAGVWGFVSGVAFKEKTKLGEIPGIGDIPGLNVALDSLSIEPVYLLYASKPIDRFVPPIPGVGISSDFMARPVKPSQIVTGKMLATANITPKRLKLDQGPAIAAKIMFKGSDVPGMDFVTSLIDVDELDARVTVGTALDIVALLPNPLSIPTGTGESLDLSDAFFGMGVTAAGIPTVKIGGETTLNLFGEMRKIVVQLIAGEESADFSEHVVGVPLPPVHAMPGVRFIEDYYLEMGLQYEPEGLNLGFMGDFYIGDPPDKSQGEAVNGDNPDTYQGKAVIVAEMIEALPNPLYVRFSIDTLTFWAMFEAMTGTMARLDDAKSGADATSKSNDALIILEQQYKNLQPVFDGISLNDVFFHWADSIVILPDGSTAMPGVGFRGWLNLFGWHTYASFEFSSGASTKLSAHLEMEPINLLGIVSVTGDGKGVRKDEATGKIDSWEAWKNAGGRNTGRATGADDGPTASNADVTTTDGDYVVSPGGPVFIVSGLHSPFLHADIRIGLFDLLHTELKADADTSGLTFQLSTGIASITNLVLVCNLQTKDTVHFEAHGTFGTHLNADLSFELPVIGEIPIHLDCGLDAEMYLHVTKDTFVMSIDGSFEFEGVLLSLPTLTITVPLSSLADLPEKILDHVDDMAEEIFGDLFDELGHVAEVAAKAIADAADEVRGEIEDVGKAAVEEAKRVGETVEKAFDATEKEVEEAADALVDGASDALSAAEDTIAAINTKVERFASDMADDAAVVVEDAFQIATQIGADIIDEVAKVIGPITDIASKAELEAAQLVADADQYATEAISAADDAANDMIDVANDFAEGADMLATQALYEIADLAEAPIAIAGEAGEAVGEGLEEGGTAVGEGAKAVGNFFGSVF